MSSARTVTLENVTPAQLVLRYLALEGTTTLFGLPGAAIGPLLYELRSRDDVFNYVICRHEGGAGVHGGRLRARERDARRGAGDVRPGRDERPHRHDERAGRRGSAC